MRADQALLHLRSKPYVWVPVTSDDTVEALRELHAENDALRAELETLRGQQARLMSALERTEARLDAIEHGTAPANAGR